MRPNRNIHLSLALKNFKCVTLEPSGLGHVMLELRTPKMRETNQDLRSIRDIDGPLQSIYVASHPQKNRS